MQTLFNFHGWLHKNLIVIAALLFIAGTIVARWA
jgi:hypothetical protein